MRLLQAARLSRLGDASTGLDKQDLECQGYAKMGGHEIISVAADTDVSGDTDPWARPELGPWLTKPELTVQYDGIIASHIDRLARSTIHFMRLLHWADEHGKKIITTGEQGIDFSTPVGKLLGYIISWLGEQELEAIKRRSIATQKYLKDNDFLVGRAPFGYRAVTKGNHKVLGRDPATNPYVVEMVRRYLAGESQFAIAQWLTGEGLKSPNGKGNWDRGTVASILRNPILIGRRVNKHGKVLLKTEPTIDLGTWRELQEMLKANSNRSMPSKGAGLLLDVLYCGECGRKMHQQHSGRTDKKSGKSWLLLYWRCRGTSSAPSTCRNMIRQDVIEAYLDEQMQGEIIGSHPVLEPVVIPGSGYAAEIEQLDQDIRDLDPADPDFLAHVTRLHTERARLAALPGEPERVIMRPTGETFAERWPTLDRAGRRQFLLDHQVRITLPKAARPSIFLAP